MKTIYQIVLQKDKAFQIHKHLINLLKLNLKQNGFLHLNYYFL